MSNNMKFWLSLGVAIVCVLLIMKFPILQTPLMIVAAIFICLALYFAIIDKIRWAADIVRRVFRR
ncbi:hypothetical protein C0674_13500 [Sporolactobacillus terrae]|uniref:Uncharacterized protein n=1 Tax=Sporolactobacillus terrae TaxID=269673 RepID=A0ABX5QAC1_9BACL|nr:hypothetical protein C0674_13500 [Sporolactobacillus terrae]QAA26502.1 hypothetical protein C0679_13485 [Sporolactobacillus terrae]